MYVFNLIYCLVNKLCFDDVFDFLPLCKRDFEQNFCSNQINYHRFPVAKFILNGTSEESYFQNSLHFFQ